jgi:hypothetical protein
MNKLFKSEEKKELFHWMDDLIQLAAKHEHWDYIILAKDFGKFSDPELTLEDILFENVDVRVTVKVLIRGGKDYPAQTLGDFNDILTLGDGILLVGRKKGSNSRPKKEE